MIARIRRRARHGDGGFTLIELTVTLLVLGIVLAILFNFLANAMGITARANRDVRVEQDAQTALRIVTEDLRSARYRAISPCAAAGLASCVTVEIAKSTLAAQDCPKRVVTFAASGGVLRQTLTDYAADCATVTKQQARNLLTGLTGTSIFTYYGADGITPIDINSAPLATVQAATAVATTLSVQFQTNSPTLTFKSTASLRNNR